MRVHGTEGVAPIECINPIRNKWRVRWDIQPNTEEDFNRPASGVTYEEAEFLYRPSLAEIKTIVLAWSNDVIDHRIRNEFTWNDIPVWLSTENQFNYKAAYDMAVQTAGASLPVTFKFGTEAAPVYKDFTELTEITDFYLKALTFVNDTLAKGWAEKDGIDWSVYEAETNNNQ